MPISRELVLLILKYLIENPKFHFPFFLFNQNFDGSDESYIIEFSKQSYQEIEEHKEYKKFILAENLQNMYSETIELMSKGFIEKIINENVIDKISKLAMEYRISWNEDLWESLDIVEFGLNEFIGGKAEAYEECLEILKLNNSSIYN